MAGRTLALMALVALVALSYACVAPPPASAAASGPVSAPETFTTCLLGYGDTGGPVANCTRALETVGLSPAYRALAFGMRGEGYCDAGRTDLGVADETQAIALAPDFPRAWAARANCRLAGPVAEDVDVGRIAKGQVEVGDRGRGVGSSGFAAAIAEALHNPGAASRPVISDAASQCLWTSSQGGDGIGLCARALALRDFAAELLPLIYHARGLGYCGSAQYALAIADQTSAIALAPDYPQAFIDRSHCHQGLNDHAAALADLNAGIALAPKVPGFLYERGEFYNWNGRHDLALADFAKARGLAPRFSNALDSHAMVLFGLGRFAEAAPELATVVHEVPGDVWPVLWLHVARARAGQPDAREFEANMRTLHLGDWPRPIFEIFLGTATDDDVSTVAWDHPENGAPEGACEASVFSAQYRLIRGDLAAARNWLNEAVSVCGAWENRWMVSWAEIKRLDPKAGAAGPW